MVAARIDSGPVSGHGTDKKKKEGKYGEFDRHPGHKKGIQLGYGFLDEDGKSAGFASRVQVCAVIDFSCKDWSYCQRMRL